MIFLARLILFALNLYVWGLIFYAILSWIQHPTALKIFNWLGQFYLPLLTPLRKWIKPGNYGFDVTPMILVVGIFLVKNVVLLFIKFLY